MHVVQSGEARTWCSQVMRHAMYRALYHAMYRANDTVAMHHAMHHALLSENCYGSCCCMASTTMVSTSMASATACGGLHAARARAEVPPLPAADLHLPAARAQRVRMQEHPWG